MNTQQIVQLPIYVLNKCCFAATTGRVNERVAYVHVMTICFYTAFAWNPFDWQANRDYYFKRKVAF